MPRMPGWSNVGFQISIGWSVSANPFRPSSVQNLLRVKKDPHDGIDRKSTRLNSSHGYISYAVFCLKKKKMSKTQDPPKVWFTGTASKEAQTPPLNRNSRERLGDGRRS